MPATSAVLLVASTWTPFLEGRQPRACRSAMRRSGPLRGGKLQVGQAAHVQPGTAGTAHQPQQDLVAYRAAGDHAGGVVEHPRLGHRGGGPAPRAAPDGAVEVDAEDVTDVAGERVAVAPPVRAGHRRLRPQSPKNR